MTQHVVARSGPDAVPVRYRVGLIGEGITASLTPALHEREAAALGLDYRYDVFDLIEQGRRPEDVGVVLREAAGRGYAAMNITHPCKQLVLEVVDDLDDDARRLRAANLVVFRDGRLVGYNTDWLGFRDGLIAGLPDASLESVVQIGCGGAGAATAYALLSCGASRLALSDADDDRAHHLAERMRGHFPRRPIVAVGRTELSGAIAEATGVVHATPMGMLHHPGIAFDVDLLRPGAWVADIVYRPLQTALLREVARRGHPILDGSRMVVGQAYSSLQIITGERPDRHRMEASFRALIRHEDSALSGSHDG